jgi:hypothetical protein
LKNKASILLSLITILPFVGKSQNNTYSPYSRYGVGVLNQQTFAHNTGMGGAHIALKPDSTMPIFINVGNPASYPLIRLTTLEVGGSFLSSQFKGNNNTSLRKWNTNFAYGALGFPVGANGGACFGVLPFSSVGYETKATSSEANVGNVQYIYNGDGGLTKAFIGYGIMPFNKRLIRFRSKHFYTADSLKTITHKQYMKRQVLNKLLSDFSVGVNVNYVFGGILNSTRVIYPNSLNYNNTFRERVLNVGDFTGNFGMQTGLSKDSVTDHKGRMKKIEAEVKAWQALGVYSESQLKLKKDSLSSATPVHKRALRHKVKVTFGYFMNLNNGLKANYTTGVYNYILNGSGQEILRDTVLFDPDKKGTIKLPLEQGFGIGFKKGEKLNVVADFAITDWQTFKYLDEVSDLKKNYRLALGMNFVPEKYAAGRDAFFRRINYRLGASYQTGYIYLNDSYISNYSISAGIGLPVGIGRLSSMINISGEYGVVGSNDPTLIKQNYWRVNFGFTFCDRWFQKFRYD